MKLLAGCSRFAFFIPVVLAACGNKDTSPPAPDYDSLRREDDTKHDAYPPPPAAGNHDGWPKLAPDPGQPINMGIVGGNGSDAGPDGPPDTGVDTGVDTGFDAGIDVREAAVLNYDLIITNNLYVPGSTRPSPTLFMPDATTSISRSGSFTIRTTTLSALLFTWTAPDANAIGYAIQFGNEAYVYLADARTAGLMTGSGTMSIEVYSTACSQLPATCFQTSMKLYLVNRPVEGGITAGLSTPIVVPVAIDCGGCL
jgi:hypothetical protein